MPAGHPPIHKSLIYSELELFSIIFRVGQPVSHLVCYTIRMKMKNENNHFIVTTKTGSRWAAIGASFAQVRREFFGNHLGKGMQIVKIEKGRLFTPDEEEELRREKIEQMCR